MYFLIFLVLSLILPILGYWPIVSKTDDDWSNSNLGIHIVDPTKLKPFGLLCGYAEELSEWYFKTFVYGLLTLPFALLVAKTDPLLNFAALMIMQFLPVLTMIPIVERIIEYVGKSANIAVSPRSSAGSALRLQEYYASFKGMELEEIQKGIANAMPIGSFLVKLLSRNIKRHTR